MKMASISVIVATYRRPKPLERCLRSLSVQSVLPNQVLVVLRPSGDLSEAAIESFSKKLPIEMLRQAKGNVVAAEMEGLRRSDGDIVLFLDDDAVAERQWCSRFGTLFSRLDDAGGISAPSFKAYSQGSRLSLSDEMNTILRSGRRPEKVPMKIYEGYCTWISTSGWIWGKTCSAGLRLSAGLSGVNMGFRREAIEGIDIEPLYAGSKKCLQYEHVLGVIARMRGYNTYECWKKEEMPIVWHVEQPESLSRHGGVKAQFWNQSDRAQTFWRMRALGAETSLWRYLFSVALTVRSGTLGLGSAWGVVWGLARLPKQWSRTTVGSRMNAYAKKIVV